MARTASGGSGVASGSRAYLDSLQNLPWPPLFVLLAIASPGWLLDARYRVLPKELALTIAALAVFLVALCFAERVFHQPRLERITTVVLAEGATIANILLLFGLLWMMANSHELDGRRLLSSAIFIWVSNVLVFALAYWATDGGGPEDRRSDTPYKPDFIFPEMQQPGETDAPFRPNFGDYLYLAFSTSTAFSATDTLTASSRARLLLVLQASVSLITLAVVAARAVNILPTGQ
ncbi:MAG: DUF1345 domain-containing protein [Candidatus Eremiobacteraeota bacterium]|nr:DUF1345 domain-containing protein [Candidatus Eremiobacteraeota bacterium]